MESSDLDDPLSRGGACARPGLRGSASRSRRPGGVPGGVRGRLRGGGYGIGSVSEN
jgi:hypothetical protein